MNVILAEIGKPLLPGSLELGPFTPELILVGTIVAALLVPFLDRKSVV